MTSVPMDVPENEGGLLRIFRIDTGTEAGAALRSAITSASDDAGARAAEALGVDKVDPWWVTHVRTEDIAELGLATFLAEGYDIPHAALSEQSDALNSATGSLLLVQSPAFETKPEQITPSAHISPLAAFDTRGRPAPAEAMAKANVRPVERTPEPPDRRDGGGGRPLRPLVLFLILIVVAVLVGLAAFAAGTPNG